jgi:ribosome maturation factor RimP
MAEALAETVNRLHALIEPVLAREGLELVDLQLKRTGRRFLLRLFIDRAGRASYQKEALEATEGIGIGDCARLSKTLSPLLDVEDLIPGAYTFEVSSPGLDRPLKTPSHFARAQGLPVRIKTRVPVEGVSFFMGDLAGVHDEGVRLMVRGVGVDIPYRFIEKANLDYKLG